MVREIGVGPIWVSINDTTDVDGPYIYNVIVGLLLEENYSKPYLLWVKITKNAISQLLLVKYLKICFCIFFHILAYKTYFQFFLHIRTLMIIYNRLKYITFGWVDWKIVSSHIIKYNNIILKYLVLYTVICLIRFYETHTFQFLISIIITIGWRKK